MTVDQALTENDDAGVEQQIEQLGAQATLFVQQGRYPQALAAATEACDLSLRRLGAVHPRFAVSLQALGLVCQVTGKQGEAERLYQQSVEVFRRIEGEENANYAMALSQLAGLHRERETMMRPDRSSSRRRRSSAGFREKTVPCMQ
jgi:Flp pilus assembly protein TadD